MFTRRNASVLGMMIAANIQGAVADFDSFERGAFSIVVILIVGSWAGLIAAYWNIDHEKAHEAAVDYLRGVR